MTPRERIEAAIAGRQTDRPPFAFWRHFPREDLDPRKLARRHVDFQRRFGFDLLKVTPAAGFMAEMWGVRLEYRDDDEGTRHYLTTVVDGPEAWRNLTIPDMKSGVPEREIRAIHWIRKEIPEEIPVVQTVFSPLSIAAKLRGPDWLRDLRERPDDLKVGLGQITEAVRAFSAACLAAGADGIFFATQTASRRVLSEAEYREFAEPFDRAALDAVASKSRLIVGHAHGADPHFDRLADYPFQILNWHDRETEPSLADGLKRFRGIACGGIERKLFHSGDEAELRRRVRDALEQTGGRRFMLGAGCVMPVGTPEALIDAARSELERLA